MGWRESCRWDRRSLGIQMMIIEGRASELADVLEVLKALAAAHDMSWEDVVSEADRKRAERGGFGNRIFLEYVDRAR